MALDVPSRMYRKKVRQSCPVLLVSERLGHEDVQTTLRTYGHLYPSTVPEAVKKLDDLMP